MHSPHGLDFVDGKVYFTAESSKVVGRYDPSQVAPSAPYAAGNVLKGLAVSPGVVTGPARVELEIPLPDGIYVGAVLFSRDNFERLDVSAKKTAKGVKFPPVALAESVGKPGTMVIVCDAALATVGSDATV